jgi:hypothetical protein
MIVITPMPVSIHALVGSFACRSSETSKEDHTFDRADFAVSLGRAIGGVR